MKKNQTLPVVGAQRMTSLEIAEVTGKQHYHLMRDIRNMEAAWEKVNGTKFGLVRRLHHRQRHCRGDRHGSEGSEFFPNG